MKTYYLREFVLTTVLMAAARVEPRVGAALDDSNSGGNLVNYGQNSRSIIWVYDNNDLYTFGPDKDHHNS